MEFMFWVWLGVIAVTLIIEIITLDLVSIWFSIGGIIPFILSAIGGIAIEIQIAVFVVVSALLIIFIRKYAQRLLFKNMNLKTNVDALIGKRCKLIDPVELEKNGSAKINGIVWSVSTEDSTEIKSGALVEVIEVSGNKLIVKEIQSEEDKEKSKDQIDESTNKEEIKGDNK